MELVWRCSWTVIATARIARLNYQLPSGSLKTVRFDGRTTPRAGGESTLNIGRQREQRLQMIQLSGKLHLTDRPIRAQPSD